MTKRSKFDPSLFKYTGSRKRTGRTEPEGYVYNGTTPFRYKTTGRITIGDTTYQPGSRVTIKPGQRISNRQYQNLRYQASGWRSKSQAETIRQHMHDKHPARALVRKGYAHEAGAYRFWAAEYARHHNMPINSVLQIDSDFSQLYASALNDNFTDLSNDGPLATLLAATGLRQDDWEWSVGETP